MNEQIDQANKAADELKEFSVALNEIRKQFKTGS